MTGSEILLKPFLRLAVDLPLAAPGIATQDCFERIRALLARHDAGLLPEDRFRLKRSVVIAALDGMAPRSAVAAMLGIWEATRQCVYVAPLSEERAWRDAIALASADAFSLDAAERQLTNFSRERAVVDAARRLSSRGYRHEIGDAGLTLLPKDLQRLCERLDKLAKRLGGHAVADQVLSKQGAGGRLFEGSLLYGRQVEQTMLRPRMPSIPWHYLFQLAMKHFGAQPTSGDPGQDWRQLLELGRDLCATLDVEPYSAFDGLTLHPAGLQGALKNLVCYDEIFSFQQWQPKYAADLLEAWLASMNRQGFRASGLQDEGWRRLARSMIAAAAEDRFQATTAHAHAPTGIPVHDVARVFHEMSAETRQLNRDYLTPSDTEKRTAPYTPLLRGDAGSFLLPPRALIGRSLYEWLYARLRAGSSPGLENAMGVALEEMAKAAVERAPHQRIVAARKYLDPLTGKELELDLFIEKPDRIFLVECKKKPLTNVARGGGTLNTMVDMSGALLEMLLQLARHERVLRANGEIVFKKEETSPAFNTGEADKVELKGREVEKIAVSMLDHGSLQDRLFITTIVDSLFGRQLAASGSTAGEEALKGVNKKLKALEEEITRIAGAAGETIAQTLRRFDISSWWLGIDVLTYLCREHDDLWAALKPLRHLTFRTGDIMTEISHLRRMRG